MCPVVSVTPPNKAGICPETTDGSVVVAVVLQLYTFSHESNFSDDGDNEVILNVNVAKMSSTSRDEPTFSCSSLAKSEPANMAAPQLKSSNAKLAEN